MFICFTCHFFGHCNICHALSESSKILSDNDRDSYLKLILRN